MLKRYVINMPKILYRENCTIMLSILYNVNQTVNMLGDLIQQSPDGFIFLVGMWQSDDQSVYEVNDITYIDTYVPIMFTQEARNQTYLYIYCPNSTVHWQVRLLNSKEYPTLCPSKWIEGHLKVADWDKEVEIAKSGVLPYGVYLILLNILLAMKMSCA